MYEVDLPNELLLDVLSRLPVKTLLRFMRVSKSWRDLIGSRYFSTMNLNRFRDTDSKIIVRAQTRSEINSRLYIFDYNTKDVKKLNYPPLKCKKNTGVKLLGTTNGVICLLYAYRKFVIWNPLSLYYIEIAGPIFSGFSSNRKYCSAYGFAYEKTTNDYKVVSLITLLDKSLLPVSYHGWIYSLKLQKWKKLENFAYRLKALDSILVSGALHWITKDNNILSLDLADETFHIIPKPDSLMTAKYPYSLQSVYSVQSVGILGDCLSLTARYDWNHNREIWVMKDYGVKDSWTMIYLEPERNFWKPKFWGNRFIRPISYSKGNKQVFIHDSEEQLYLYHLEKHSTETVLASMYTQLDSHYASFSLYPSVYPYIESLECYDFMRDETSRNSSGCKRTRGGETDDMKWLIHSKGIKLQRHNSESIQWKICEN